MTSASKVWPYTVVVPISEVQEKWLEQNMGPMCGRWYLSRYGIRTATYHFSDDRDAVLFALRWA